MKLIVGLGNPGEKYITTRHNAGFLAVDHYLKNHAVTWDNKFDALMAEININDEKVIFAKPQTFMNLSGKSVAAIVNFYKIAALDDLLVVHDEKDLPFGTIKQAKDSSSAGHNGVQDIIDSLGTKNFERIRVGIETRPVGSPVPTDAFVLQPFSAEELKQLSEKIFPEIEKQITDFIKK